MTRTETKAFKTVFCSADEHTVSAQGASFRAHITYDEARKRLGEFDVVIIPGGGTDAILKKKCEPLSLIKAFAELQKKNPLRERTLMSVCTGSILLAQTGILSGLSATTHPDFFAKFENVCSEAARRDMADRTDVMEERYVVNNLRFDLGENEDENPYIHRKPSGGTDGSGRRRSSNARKGSISLKQSNTRRESIIKRMNLRLGGLRVVTTGGVTSGIDGALYLVGALVSDGCAEEVARVMCYDWKKGVVVDGTDV